MVVTSLLNIVYSATLAELEGINVCNSISQTYLQRSPKL